MDLHTKLPGVSEAAIDLIAKCLAMDSAVRPTAIECMRHRYFDELWDEEDVVLYEGDAIRFVLEGREASVPLLRLGFLAAVSRFHPEVQSAVTKAAAAVGVDPKAIV